MDEQNQVPAETLNELYEMQFTMTFCTPRPTDEDIEEYKILKGGI